MNISEEENYIFNGKVRLFDCSMQVVKEEPQKIFMKLFFEFEKFTKIFEFEKVYTIILSLNPEKAFLMGWPLGRRVRGGGQVGRWGQIRF